MWAICFAAAVIFIACGAAAFFFKKKGERNQIRYLGAGVFLAAAAACFPVMRQQDDAGFALAMSLSHSIRMFVVDTGVDDITGALHAAQLGGLFYPYKILVCALYLLAPMFTLTVVLRYFSNFFEAFRLRIRFRRNLYIFSELNERSLEIAANLYEDTSENRKNAGIVFCCSNDRDSVNEGMEERARKLDAVFVPGEMTGLRLGNKKRYTAYFQISDDEDKNIDDTLRMIDNMTGDSPWVLSGKLNQKNTAVYCYATSAEAEVLLDAKDKEDLRVVLMDEVRDAVYEQLYQYPLYYNLPPGDNRICLLIVGGGKTGAEFLKAAVWYGQMYQFDLEIHMVDLEGNKIRKNLGMQCPELFDGKAGYRIEIHKGNIFSEKIENYLDGLGQVNYCVAALDDDEQNIRAAVWLRRYFYLREAEVQPFICASMKSAGKAAAVWEMYEKTRTGSRLSYNIIPFGTRGRYFCSRSDTGFIMEYLGLGVQAHYFRLTQDSDEAARWGAVRNFYEKQVNRRSSIASGIHIDVKLWELGLGIMRIPDDTEQKEIFQKLVHPVDFFRECKGRLEPYYNLEHERWMAYMRSEGWRSAARDGQSLDAFRECYGKYCTQFKNQNYLMKLHPALVPLHSADPAVAGLQEVDRMISEVNRQKNLGEYSPDYVQSDIELVDHIGEIAGGAWCGESGININGIIVYKGEYMICRLVDMNRYYTAIYRDKAWSASAAELIPLRVQIRRCSFGILRRESDKEIRAEAWESLSMLAGEEMLSDEAEYYHNLAGKETRAV